MKFQTGLLTQSQYGNGQIVKNDYDNSDRIISRTFNNQQFKYSYDADGNLGYHEDLVNQVNYRYSYDLSNRLTKVSDNKGNALNYSFDNGDATDSSGHGNNGITHGNPNFVDSPRGKALKLSGESPAGLQWVEFNDFDVPDTFSVSLWLKPDSTADGQSFLGKHTDTGNNIFLMGYWDNGYEVAVRNGYNSSVGTGAKTADYQHLVAVVKKVDDTKSRVTVYKNNEELWSQEIK